MIGGKRVAAVLVAVLFALVPLISCAQTAPIDETGPRQLMNAPFSVRTDPLNAQPEALVPLPTPLPMAGDCTVRPLASPPEALCLRCAQRSHWVALRRGAENISASAFQCYMDHPHHAPPVA